MTDSNRTRIKALEAEVKRLKAKLSRAKANTEEQGRARQAMLFMLEDMNESRAAIETAKREWETTFDAVSDPIFLHDCDGSIIRANRAYAEHAGCSIEAMIGKRYWDVFPKGGSQSAACHAAPQNGETEEEITLESGETFLSRAYPVLDDKGKCIYTIHLLRDISERKHAEIAIEQSRNEFRAALEATIAAAGKAVGARDPYTAGHQLRVAQLAGAIGRELGLEEACIKGISMGAMIHDIGKIHIPAELLSKPGRLTEIEFSMMKTHTEVGYDILRDIPFPWPVADIAHQHHERLDGSGYPQGLKDNDICLEARIVAVADVVEAMSSHRPYRPGLGIDKALGEIRNHGGKFYDSRAVDACVRLFTEKRFKFV